MGLIFPPPTTTERVLGAPPAVEPNRHAVCSPATDRRTDPPRRFRPRAKSSKRRPRTVSSASASVRRRHDPNLHSPPPPVPRATADSTACWSCLAGPVVTDPDSGALVCTSCGLVHDLGAAEFFHQTADEVDCLVIHGTDEPVADLTCCSDSDADMLISALYGLVHGLGAAECAEEVDLGLSCRIARPPRAVEHEASEENKEL